MRAAAGDAVVHDYRLPADDRLPQMVIAASEQDPAALTEKALAAIGGIQRFVRKGDVVAIKPNIGWDRTIAHAANTHPEVVAFLVRAALQAGAKRVIVIDRACDDGQRSLDRSGIGARASNAGAEVIVPTEAHEAEYQVRGAVIDTWSMLRPVLEADRVINVPIAKHHGSAKFTGALKNWIGICGGERFRLHGHLNECIVDLAHFVRPTLTVIDATRVLLRNGPKGGNLDDVKHTHTVVACTDPVAADAFACTLIGKRPDEITYLAQAEARRLGTVQWSSLRHVRV